MAVKSVLPPTQRALKVASSNTFSLVENAPLPAFKLGDSVLIRVVCVAINPVDGKSADMSPTPGATGGTDFSGVVVAFGTDVEYGTSNNAKPLRIGDRVMGFAFGNNPQEHDNGAFAEYVAVPGCFVWNVPDAMDFQTAATLPVGIASVGLSLHYLKLPMPSAPNSDSSASRSLALAHDSNNIPFVLVYGGGTSTGSMAIQVLKFAGFVPITCCSPSSATLAKHLGAAATFDYQSPTCGRDIREYTEGSLSLAIDCISELASMSICYEAIGPSGGRYVSLDPFPIRGVLRRSIVPEWICAFTQFGQSIPWAPPYNLEARPDDRRFAEGWYAVAQQLLDAGMLEAPAVEGRKGGLESVSEGIEEVRKGLVKQRKLVYIIAQELCAG